MEVGGRVIDIFIHKLKRFFNFVSKVTTVSFVRAKYIFLSETGIMNLRSVAQKKFLR